MTTGNNIRTVFITSVLKLFRQSVYVELVCVSNCMSSLGNFTDRAFNDTVENVRYTNTLFHNVTFSHVVFSHVNFINCEFYESEFSNVKSSRTYFENSTIRESR